MTSEHYNEIKNTFGSKSSWAIWDASSPKSTELIEQDIDKLNLNFVIVGLNPSKGLNAGTWHNFHSGSQGDKRLMKAFNDPSKKYHGAYMMDLLSNVFFSSSSESFKEIFEIHDQGRSDVLKRQKKAFNSELDFLGASGETKFVLLGNIVQNYFDLFTDFEFPNKIFLKHFSQYRGQWVPYASERLSESI